MKRNYISIILMASLFVGVPASTPSTQGELLQAIEDEISIEFALESHRWFDKLAGSVLFKASPARDKISVAVPSVRRQCREVHDVGCLLPTFRASRHLFKTTYGCYRYCVPSGTGVSQLELPIRHKESYIMLMFEL